MVCANSQHAVLYLLLFVALLPKSDISYISLTGRTPVQGEHRHRSSRKSGGRRLGRGDQSSAHEIHRSHGSPSRIGTRCTTRMWPLQPHQIKASWCNCHKSYCRDLELWIIMTYYDICQLLVAVGCCFMKSNCHPVMMFCCPALEPGEPLEEVSGSGQPAPQVPESSPLCEAESR